MAFTSPAEDLMNEHGILRRILLIYDEFIAQLRAPGPDGRPSPNMILHAAKLFRLFGEDYHEKTEEQYVFPRVGRRHSALVRTLIKQHLAGRVLTNDVMSLAYNSSPALVEPLHLLVRMYRPHAAWEDTVIFPAFTEGLSEEQLVEFSELFEDTEHTQFGPHGFEDILTQVHMIEQALGIGNLARFTP